MTMDSDLIDRIYEAAVLPERWAGVLQDIADHAGAVGAVFINQRTTGVSWVASPRLEQAVDDYMRSGWIGDNRHTAPLFEEQYPGFRPETAYRTVAEIERLPVKAEFFIPRGLIAAVATVFQGSRNDALHVALEGFPTHGAAEAAAPRLDAIRQHLGRALSLTALHAERSRIVVESLALAGVAAVIGGDGRLRSANDGFTRRMGDRMLDSRIGLRFTDRFLQEQFAAALERHRVQLGRVQSVPVRDGAGGPPFVVHILPITGGARELCETDGVLLLLADSANASIPGADLLRLLFDLTPAEARLTRYLVEGRTLAQAASAICIREGTARTHLRSVFAKTGVTRQAELVRLLAGLGAPG